MWRDGETEAQRAGVIGSSLRSLTATELRERSVDGECNGHHDCEFGQVGQDKRALGGDRGAEVHVRAPHEAKGAEKILEQDRDDTAHNEQRSHDGFVVARCAVGNVPSCSGAEQVAEQITDAGARESLDERAAAGEDGKGETDEQEQAGGQEATTTTEHEAREDGGHVLQNNRHARRTHRDGHESEHADERGEHGDQGEILRGIVLGARRSRRDSIRHAGYFSAQT